MRALSTTYGRDGKTRHRVTFSRPESAPVPCMIEEGVIYRHPARTHTADVWTSEGETVADVLNYHFGRSWTIPTIT